MKCERCKINNYETRKNGQPKFTLVWDNSVSDFKRMAWCKQCRCQFEKLKREQAKLKREQEKAPLEIMITILSLGENEEWELKLKDAEYLIKRIK